MISQNTQQKLPGAAFAYLLFGSVIIGALLFARGFFVLSLGTIHGTSTVNGVSSPSNFSAFWPGIALVIIGIILPVYKLLWCSAFSFTIGDRNVTINSGVLFRQSKTIDYGRIQNVDNARGPIQMMFGITAVNIWTASQDQFHTSTTMVGGIPRTRQTARPEGKLYLLKQDAEDA